MAFSRDKITFASRLLSLVHFLIADYENREQMKDIETLDDIKTMVNTFYGTVREDDLIGPIFNRVIADIWPEHLNKMYGFWQSILLNEPTYSGRPFPPHLKLGAEKEHFERWVELFVNTVNALFQGERADEAIKRAKLMAALFHSKIEHFKDNNSSLLDR